MTPRPALLCTAALAAVLLTGCRFERRPELERGAGLEVASLESPLGDAAAADSVRDVMEAFGSALELGDVTRVSQLTVPGALLIDQEEHIRWSRGSAEAGLPRPLLDSDEGLGWNLVDSQLTPLGGDAVLLVNRYHATVSGEDVSLLALESLVLVRTDQGWRVRYLHRSRGPGEPDEGA